VWVRELWWEETKCDTLVLDEQLWGKCTPAFLTCYLDTSFLSIPYPQRAEMLIWDQKVDTS
jgi:hypothetical protein